MPDRVEILTAGAAGLDFLQLFTSSRSELEHWFPQARDRIKQEGMIWISWPKRASKMSGDLNKNIVREIGLNCGLVDVKVAAIDQDWSGLKFMIRIKDREGQRA